MARYIDAEAAKADGWQIRRDITTPAGMNFAAVEIRDITSLPAADVVEVVRCKDCRFRDPEDHKCDNGELERQGCPFWVADDYFCAYGAKMDESEGNDG